MGKNFFRFLVLVLTFVFSATILGCAVRFEKRHPRDIARIKQLSEQVQKLQETKQELETRLQKEISQGKVSLEMKKKGLVVTVVAKVLFNSGKAKVRPEGKKVLSKVADVLAKINEDILIEGHTDNVPIKYSGWKSNWELSSQRALNVLHYFVDERGLEPKRFAAVGYGAYRPIASNLTKEGRKKNRRVEIVVMPTKFKEINKGPELNHSSRPQDYIK